MQIYLQLKAVPRKAHGTAPMNNEKIY